jgi:hypothetical protein
VRLQVRVAGGAEGRAGAATGVNGSQDQEIGRLLVHNFTPAVDIHPQWT